MNSLMTMGTGMLLMLLPATAYTPAGRAVAAARVAQKEVPTGQEDQDDDLADRLLRRSTGEADEDVMDRIIRLMNEAGRRLDLRFDPGAETQAVQSKILDELEEAIKAAAARQRRRQGSPSPTQGDSRKQQDPSKQRPGEDKPPEDAGESAAAGDPSDAPQPGAGAVDGAAAEGALLDRRRGWGHLPQRDRDEILQNYGERMLERYQAWIERYYRALQSDPEDLEQP